MWIDLTGNVLNPLTHSYNGCSICKRNLADDHACHMLFSPAFRCCPHHCKWAEKFDIMKMIGGHIHSTLLIGTVVFWCDGP